jgi:tetratricopeptide (TPR) repeat protein
MFEFGRELRRIFGNQGRFESDSSLYELLNLELLISQGRSLDIEAGRVSTKNRFDPHIESAVIWREYARRTGDPLAMRKAAAAAESAGKDAKTIAQAVQAVLEQALTCLTGADLFETAELLTSAEGLLAEGRVAMAGISPADPVLNARLSLVEGMLGARLALREGVGELDAALNAMAHIDRAVEKFDKQVRLTKTNRDKIWAAQARLERADLLMAVGIDRQDSSLLGAVIKDLEAVRARLDPAYEPVTFAAIVTRLAEAHIHQGQIEGNAEAVSIGIALLSAEDELMVYEHSPLDWVCHKMALSRGLEVLATLTGADYIFDKALAVYDLALKRPLQKGLGIRARLMSLRASCLAQRAEATGDLKALDDAERAFKEQLRATRPLEDPIDWAILQTNLGKLYVTRGDITGFMLERAQAAYALDAAKEIFIEHGLHSLAATAESHLVRLRGI